MSEGKYNMIRNKRADINHFEATCRITTDPIISMRKTSNCKELVPYVTFGCVTNSSPMNKNKATYFTACAWGKIGEEIYDRLKKGYSIHIHGSLYTMFTTTRAMTNGTREIQESMIQIKEYFIHYIPTPQEEDSYVDPKPLTLEDDPL